MRRAIGVLAMEHIAVGLVESHRLVGPMHIYPPDGSASNPLQSMPADQIAEMICEQMNEVVHGQPVDAIGVGFPGIIRNGVVEESPNLPQTKGFNLASTLSALLGKGASVRALNDADAFAAGVAATRGHLHDLIRVWTLGSGVGLGRYPSAEGIWEGGHVVVSLDPKEKVLRVRRHRSPRRHRRTPGDAPAVPGPRAGGSVCQRAGRRSALRGLRSDLASRPGRGHRDEHSPRGPRAFLPVRPECDVRRPASARLVPARDGHHEPAPGQRAGAGRGQRRNGNHWCRP